MAVRFVPDASIGAESASLQAVAVVVGVITGRVSALFLDRSLVELPVEELRREGYAARLAQAKRFEQTQVEVEEDRPAQAVAPGHSAVYNRAVVNAKSVAIGSPMSDNPASSPFAIPTTIQE